MSVPLEFTGQYDPAQRNFDRLATAVFGPVPQVRVYNSANLTIATGTGTALTFNSERYDEGALHSTSSNTSRLTAPVAGLYSIGACVRWAASSAGIRTCHLRLNGTTDIAAQDVDVDSAMNHVHNLSTEYQLAAGDYVEVFVAQNSGGNLNVEAVLNYSPEFWMHRVAGFTAQVFD